MAIIRLQEKIPEVYTNTSRDFQLLTRLYDLIINGFKYDTDNILNTINTDKCDNRLIQLLQTKLGFFSDKYITDDDLRLILKVFPTIVKNKGSKLGIEQAVRIFFRICGLNKSKINVTVVNNTKVMRDSYIIYIDLYEKVDTTILDEILKYIIPVGCIIRYRYVTRLDNLITDLEEKIGINILVIKDSVNAQLRGDYIKYINKDEDHLIGSIGLTDVASEYNPEYKGSFDYNDDDPVDWLNNNYDVEKIRGYVYIIINKKADKSDPSKWIYTPYIYDYNSSGELNWLDMSLTNNNSINKDGYNVYSSAIYCYYKDGNFFNYKSNPFFDIKSANPIFPENHYIVTTPDTYKNINNYGDQQNLDIKIDSIKYFSKNSIIVNSGLDFIFNPNNIVKDKFIDNTDKFDFKVIRNSNITYGKVEKITNTDGTESTSLIFYTLKDEKYVIDNTFSFMPEDIIEFYEECAAVLFDEDTETYWKKDESNNWISNQSTASNSIEIKTKDGSITDCYIIPKNNVLATNCYYSSITGSIRLIDEDFSSTPTVWISEIKDNNSTWSKPIFDKSQIELYLKDNSYIKAYITGNPKAACLSAKMYNSNSSIGYSNDIRIYDSVLNKSWKTVELYIGKLDYFWIEDDLNYKIYANAITYSNSEMRAVILPKKNVYIYDLNNFFSCSSDEPAYKNRITQFDRDIIYIDRDTSNGYALDITGQMQKVINYNKINDVFSIDHKDLMELLEYGLIKPAFKNEQVIFKDSYGNMLLL